MGWSERLASKTPPPPETLGPGFLSCVYEDWRSSMDKRRRRSSYIDELPDEMLQDILSRLEVKEAVKTCVVSRRWRNLWTVSTTYETISHSHSRVYYEYASSGAIVVRYREVASSCSTIKDSMILAFDTEKDGNNIPHDYSRMNEWIQATLLSRAPVLDTGGRLQNARLTALCLDSVSMNCEDFKNCAMLCPNLVTLVVANAPVVCVQVGVQYCTYIDLKLHSLKHLEFRCCKKLALVDCMAAPNLESFKLANKKQKCFTLYGLNKKESITSISLQVPLNIQLLQNFQRFSAPRMEQLELNIEDLIRDMSLFDPDLLFPEFSNLKQLKLIFNFSSHIMDLAFFIKASPRLQKLTLVYGCTKNHDVDVVVDDVDDDRKHFHFDEGSYVLHQHLRVVEFIGWSGHESEVRLASFVIKTATHLQDLVFYPFTPRHLDASGAYTFNQSILRGRDSVKKAKACARRIINKLKTIKSSRP